MLKQFYLAIFVMLPVVSIAQTAKVTGVVVNATSKQSLPGTNVILISQKDSTKKHLAASNARGEFVFNNIPMQTYRLEVSFVGFEKYSRNVVINKTPLSLGSIKLTEEVVQLAGATIVKTAVRASVKGDTTAYNAEAFKVAKDADAENLITKMPGITSNNGTITAQGEAVKKVLVDGKPFFGDDPTAALKSLPAEVIDKIQVFDKMSDQSEFTGFDDGNAVKTINIVTKQNRRAGQFGKIFAGYGTDNKYNVGGNVNLFKGDSRTSILGMSNNVNQQNFSSEDILGALGSGGGRGGMRMFGGPGGGPGGFGGGPGGFGGGVSNFTVGQQSGVSKTSALGINFSDKWGEKVNFTGSYFFNYSNTTNDQTTNRQYFGDADTAQHYTQTNTYSTTNYNNRVNLRIEYNINPKNSLIFTPNLTFQSTRSNSSSAAQTEQGNGTLLSKTNNNVTSWSEGYNLNNSILFRHKFDKQGRTFSLDFGLNYSGKNGKNKQVGSRLFAKSVKDTINQYYNTDNKSYGINGTAIYTEPIGSKMQLMVNYNAGFTKSDNDKRTYSINKKNLQEMLLDTLLSNVYENDYLTQRLGVGIRLKGDKINGMVNVMGQSASLSGDETFPIPYKLEKNYTNLLPMMMFNYKMDASNSLRLMFHSRTQAPSISQLQNVVDNSDPLNLYVGNPDLNQSFTNNINLRYSYTSATKGKTFFVFLSAQNTDSYITNSITTANQATALPNGTILKKGATLTKPVNLNGYWSVNSMITYGFPFALIKSNVNISAGTSFSRLPGLLDNQKYETKNISPNGSVVIGSNFSPNFDFSLSYNASYNFIKNSTKTAKDQNYWSQTAKAKLNWVIKNRFTFTPDATYQKYNGSSFNEESVLVNLNIGVKMFKNRQGELKLGVYDLLDQNQSFSRSVNSVYVEDSYNSVLKRYFMATFVYNLRNFKI